MDKFYDTRLILATLDPDFRPAIITHQAFEEAVKHSKNPQVLMIAIQRENNMVSRFQTLVFAEQENKDQANEFYLERLIKSLLWIKGGYEITIGGPTYLGNYIKSIYQDNGLRTFDKQFMERVYDRSFCVHVTSVDNVPSAHEKTKSIGRHLDGYRIGFDAGGSDRKVSAVVDGHPIYSEETIWHPKLASNPDYHYQGILDSINRAAAKMPRVDAIGISSAGIYIDNHIQAASLFINVNQEDFNQKVKNMYIDIAKSLGDIPLEVANDGDVTALAGSMSLDKTNVLGIAMGTSEAAGYVDHQGHITGWLNELAFVPIDHQKKPAKDEWSEDYGCGVKYFSQDAVIRLAKKAKIELDASLTPAEALAYVQSLLERSDERAMHIFKTIGVYLGYTIPYYALFYDIKEILILGRVTSGRGGDLILAEAKHVLETIFTKHSKHINISLPDEKNKRVGQSIAAASLAKIDR